MNCNRLVYWTDSTFYTEETIYSDEIEYNLKMIYVPVAKTK